MRRWLELNPIVQAIADWLERHGQLEIAQSIYAKVTTSITIPKYQLLLLLNSENPYTHYELAKAFLQQAQLQKAQRACQQTLEQVPDFAWAHFTLGEILQGQGQWQQAIQSFNRAIALDNAVPLFHQGVGKAQMSRENWQAAIAAYRQALTLDTQDFWSLYGLGESLAKAGYWQEAIPVLTTATQTQPAFPWSYFYLGDALLAEDRLEEAIAVYQKAVELRPNNPYIKQSLVYALHRRQQEARIQAYCQRIQEQPRSDPDRLNILMITPYAPYPPKLGAIARMFHELKCLGAKHRVVLVSLMFAREEYQFETELEHYCDLAVLAAIGDSSVRHPNEPKLVNRYSSKRLKRLLQQLQPIAFDMVVCSFVYMAQYREFFPTAFHVLTEHNIESELLKRSTEIQEATTRINRLAEQTASVRAFVAAESETELLATYENTLWEQFPLRVVVSDRDKQILDSRCSTGKTLVVRHPRQSRWLDKCDRPKGGCPC